MRTLGDRFNQLCGGYGAQDSYRANFSRGVLSVNVRFGLRDWWRKNAQSSSVGKTSAMREDEFLRGAAA